METLKDKVYTHYLFTIKDHTVGPLKNMCKLLDQLFSKYPVYFQVGMSESGYGGSMELAM